MLNLNVPLRILQTIFAVVTIALNSYIIHWYLTHTRTSSTPTSPPFLLFVSILTLLALPYLTLNPPLSHNRKPNSRFFNKYLILALDLLLSLLWFAGFIALAVFKARLHLCAGHVCTMMLVSVVMGAMAWVSFLGTGALAAVHVLRTRGGSVSKEAHGEWVGQRATAQV